MITLVKFNSKDKKSVLYATNFVKKIPQRAKKGILYRFFRHVAKKYSHFPTATFNCFAKRLVPLNFSTCSNHRILPRVIPENLTPYAKGKGGAQKYLYRKNQLQKRFGKQKTSHYKKTFTLQKFATELCCQKYKRLFTVHCKKHLALLSQKQTCDTKNL